MRQIKAQRLVIKAGTSTLMTSSGELNTDKVKQLADVIVALKRKDKQVVLVTSGAIGVGLAQLKLDKKPTLIPEKQAIAAIGQSLLMAAYGEAFMQHDFNVAQLLLTKDCLDSVKKYGNAINTLQTLLTMEVVPIINENDTVAVDEIVFGDNDTLSAYVATMINADLLVLLSDVDGLYDKNPEQPDAKLISEVTEITESLKQVAGGAGSQLGTGGMITKLEAAQIAGKNGTSMLLMNGANPNLIENAIDGEAIGTYFNLS